MIYFSIPALVETNKDALIKELNKRELRYFLLNNPFKVPSELTPDERSMGGFDLTSHTNMIVNLSAEDSDVSIKGFNCMKPGKVYMIVAENGRSTQNELVFPTSSTLYNGTITKANAMTIVYKFWTDGHSIYCDRAIYE